MSDIIESSYLPAVVDERQFMPIMSIHQAVQRRNDIVEFTRQCMTKDHDFGTIPGTPKPTLYKAGAEKLCTLFGLTPRYVLEETEKDWTGAQHGGEAFFFFSYRCQLFRGDFLVAESDGSCNSWEKKYRYVSANRKCPTCGEETIFNNRNSDDGGYFCWKAKGGCGAQFSKGDKRIESQETGKKPNPDIADLVNTIQKMAEKRALIAAVLLATNASEFFTQDTEDLPQYQNTEPSQEPQEAVQDRKTAEQWGEDCKGRAFDLGYTGKMQPLLVAIYGSKPAKWTAALLEEVYQLPDEAWQKAITALAPVPPADHAAFAEKYAENRQLKMTDAQAKAFDDWFVSLQPDSQKLSEIVGRDVACNENGFATLTDEELERVEKFIQTGVMPRLEVVEGGGK